MRTIIAFLKDENGAAAAEYALILAIVGAGIAGAMVTFGGAVSGAISNATNCIKTGGGTC